MLYLSITSSTISGLYSNSTLTPPFLLPLTPPQTDGGGLSTAFLKLLVAVLLSYIAVNTYPSWSRHVPPAVKAHVGSAAAWALERSPALRDAVVRTPIT